MFDWSLGASAPLNSLRPIIQQAASSAVTNALSQAAAPRYGTVRPYESDGPGTDPVGKQFSAMAPQELADEMGNLSTAKDALSFSPDTLPGWGVKGVGMAAGLLGVPTGVFNTLAYGASQLGINDASMAFGAMSPEARGQTVMGMSPKGWGMFGGGYGDEGLGYGSPGNEIDYGGALGDYGYGNYDANMAAAMDYEAAMNANNYGNESDGPGGGTTGQNNSAGNDYGGTGWA